MLNRIVLLANTFSKGMGYLENMLPKYFARAGVETHVITMDLPPYYWLPEFKETYGEFSGEHRAGTVESQDGYTLHILGHRKIAGYMRMVGLREKLAVLRPNIVQASVCIGWVALDAGMYRRSMDYKLFTGNHYHASVFPLAFKRTHWWDLERLQCTVTRTLPGRLIGRVTEKCYAIAPDCAEVAIKFFGVPPSKVQLCPLGVDTELFRPISGDDDRHARTNIRQQLGFKYSDIVCIYTGRFSVDKNPLLLAQAIASLVGQGLPYRGLFVGKGTQGAAIESCAGCATYPFVRVQDLAGLFRAADIGVWPAQESLSMLDAAACGIPIVANDTMTTRERIEGNGLLYRLGDKQDLIRALLALGDPSFREELGSAGAEKMKSEFSWQIVANRRLDDYRWSLSMEKPSQKSAATSAWYTDRPSRVATHREKDNLQNEQKMVADSVERL